MFRSEFSSLIATSTVYSSSEKLRLLIEALADGEAKETISDLQINDGNWVIAWTRMTDRYDSPRETVHACLRPLLELPALISQSETGLHKLISTVRTTRSQLKQVQLGAVTEAEVLYLHFILGRLDSRTLNEFNQSLPNNDVPALDTCIQFLEKQAKNVGLTKEIRTNSISTLNTSKSQIRSRKEHRVMIATSDSECGYTSSESISAPRSRKLKSKKNQPRGKSPGFKTKRTVATVKRRTSQTRSRSSSVESLPRQGFSPKPSVHTVFHQSIKEGEESGLLPTAVVAIEHGRQSVLARCLLDTGAQNSFVTEKVVNRLKLPKTAGDESFSVAGGNNLPVLGKTSFWIRSLKYPDKTFQIDAHILPEITADLPNQPIDIQDW
ncbi:unnamed protein product, partial [Allacma fusca]